MVEPVYLVLDSILGNALKKKERDRLKAKKIRTQIGHACTQNGHKLQPEYTCSRCLDCYQCAHQLVEHYEADAIYWWRCSDGFEKPAYMDVGQFASLRKAPPTQKGIAWERFR